jgi:nicotinamidase-related amidase
MSSALLVIDVQNALCTGRWRAHDIDAVVSRINQVARTVRAAGGLVVFIQHEEDHDLMRYGSEGWQLYSKLVVNDGDLRVRKTACDSFFKTELRKILMQHEVDKLLVCGLQSEFCVDSTVRGALAQGYPVTLISDAHSTLDNGVLSAVQISAHHNATLSNISSFGPPVTCIPAHELRIGV